MTAEGSKRGAIGRGGGRGGQTKRWVVCLTIDGQERVRELARLAHRQRRLWKWARRLVVQEMLCGRQAGSLCLFHRGPAMPFSTAIFMTFRCHWLPDPAIVSA